MVKGRVHCSMHTLDFSFRLSADFLVSHSHLVAALESLVSVYADTSRLVRVVLLQLLQLCEVNLHR